MSATRYRMSMATRLQRLGRIACGKLQLLHMQGPSNSCRVSSVGCASRYLHLGCTLLALALPLISLLHCLLHEDKSSSSACRLLLQSLSEGLATCNLAPPLQ